MSAHAHATPIFLVSEGSYTPYYGTADGQVDSQWDTPVVGKHGSNLLDLVYLSWADNAQCSSRPSWDIPTTGWGCGGQCVELASRWLALYVNYTHTDDKSWILGSGGSGYCGCAQGQCGQDASLYEVYNWGDRTTPRMGDVLSFSYVHAAVATHVWADDNGIHVELANQNMTMTTTQDWLGDHFASESCLVHPVEMPQFVRPARYAVDVNSDGIADVCGRAGDGIHCALGGRQGFGAAINGPAWTDAAGWWTPKYASTIQFPDVNGDGGADVCGRDSQGITCALSTGKGFGATFSGPAWSDAAGWARPQYYGTIAFPDVDGDGLADVCGRSGSGIECALSTGEGFGPTFAGPAWSDASGWDQAPYVSTIQYPDINGDGKADVCGRGSAGIECWLSNGKGFPTKVAGPAWSDHNGWGRDYYYGTIRFADLDGDGKADICGRANGGVQCQLSTGTGFGPVINGPAWSDNAGFQAPRQWYTIQLADIDGDGRLDICARLSDGMHCVLFDGKAFTTDIKGPAWSDSTGWDAPQYYMTIEASDVNGDGRADLCARDSAGVLCAISTGTAFDPPVSGPAWSDASGWNGLRYYGTIRFPGAVPHKTVATLRSSKAAGSPANADLSGSPVDGGCACSVVSGRSRQSGWPLLLGLALVVSRRRTWLARRPRNR